MFKKLPTEQEVCDRQLMKLEYLAILRAAPETLAGETISAETLVGRPWRLKHLADGSSSAAVTPSIRAPNVKDLITSVNKVLYSSTIDINIG